MTPSSTCAKIWGETKRTNKERKVSTMKVKVAHWAFKNVLTIATRNLPTHFPHDASWSIRLEHP